MFHAKYVSLQQTMPRLHLLEVAKKKDNNGKNHCFS